MSRLDDIRDELYRKREHEAIPPPQESPVPPRPEGKVQSFWTNVSATEPSLMSAHRTPESGKRNLRNWLITAGVVLFVAIATWIGYTLVFPPADVMFSLLGPSQVIAGEPAVVTVRISNRSNVRITDVEATVTFPAGTISGNENTISTLPLRVKLAFPDIPAGAETQQDIRIRPVGTLGQDLAINALYLYRPENIQSKLTQTGEFHTAISRLPVAVSVDAPDQATSGQTYTLAISVDSELSQPISGLLLGIDLPNGFSIKSVTPSFAQTAVKAWSLADLTASSSQKFIITGTLTGDPGEVKSFHIRLGRYDPTQAQWFSLLDTTNGPTIASPLLLAQATLNGNRGGTIGAGAKIDGVVTFKNNAPEKIDNVSIKLSFPEQFVALETVRAENGFYDVTTHTLTWTPASEPRLKELGPGDGGTLAFSFTMKSPLPIHSFLDKNFVFPVLAVIDSASPPADFKGVDLKGQDLTQYKIESAIGIAASAWYHNSPVPNSGPLPPKVRQTTTYTIAIQLTSGANDLTNVEVHAKLPGGVSWKGEISKDIGSIDFNSQTQEMIWRIPNLPAATGILRIPTKALFQVALTPSDSQVGLSPTLVQDITATGHDAFADTTENSAATKLTTELQSDKSSTFADWRVVQ